MTGLIRIGEQLPLDGVVVFHENHLEFKRDLTEEEWLETGQVLRRMNGAVQWWIGDWWKASIRYGEGEALAEATDFSYATCKQYGWVAEAYEKSIRIDNLDFKHHLIALSAPESERMDWLERAAEEKWSTGKLRKEIRDEERHRKLIHPNKGM